MNDREAEPGAPLEPAAERLEDAVEILRRDADALIVDRQHHFAGRRSSGVCSDGQREPPAVRHGPQAVGRQVPHDLPNLVLVGLEQHRLGGHVDVDLVVVAALRGCSQQPRRVGDARAGRRRGASPDAADARRPGSSGSSR